MLLVGDGAFCRSGSVELMGIVLSYSRSDETTVKLLARAFEAARREVWFDHDLRGGDIWWDEILRNIRDSSVFLFALSDHSLSSKACLAELAYATALGRPILPVLVGPVSTMHSHLLAGRQHIRFQPDDAVAAMEVLAEADRAAANQAPLPEPLPKEPPTPFAYLGEVRQQIEGDPLDYETQLTVVERLRRSLGEETELSARREIVTMLETLRERPWRSWHAELEATAVLEAYERMERRISGAPTVPLDVPLVERTARPDAIWSEDDARAAFLKRSEEVFAELQAGTACREAERPASTRPPVGPQIFAGVAPERGPARTEEPDARANGVPAEGSDVGVRTFHGIGLGVSTASRPPGDARHRARPSRVVDAEEPEPPAASEPSIPAPRSTTSTPAPAPAPAPASVPTRKETGIVALAMSVLFAAFVVGSGRGTPVAIFALPAVFAAVALGFSAQVTRRTASGRTAAARTASRTALVWGVVAVAVAVAALVVVLATPASVSP